MRGGRLSGLAGRPAQPTHRSADPLAVVSWRPAQAQCPIARFLSTAMILGPDLTGPRSAALAGLAVVGRAAGERGGGQCHDRRVGVGQDDLPAGRAVRAEHDRRRREVLQLMLLDHQLAGPLYGAAFRAVQAERARGVPAPGRAGADALCYRARVRYGGGVARVPAQRPGPQAATWPLTRSGRSPVRMSSGSPSCRSG